MTIITIKDTNDNNSNDNDDDDLKRGIHCVFLISY